ncbi:MAG: SUMF1/EgtB/PvdO family nonheme iron enzyme [Bacteroidales bacterium]|nr:SUMF1/EgtB/PvdO family nonheme iron enzyme [Bacteroidales bacterium]HPD95216.1 SUMF1/EgtB/PvdO family nonheme iron enzyme [Tenuifilaceae bacterium]HRX31492.1 SUMF1/EgtB/PvdO family nonheme iron enzyme [Tenuifilaceae bacterium]
MSLKYKSLVLALFGIAGLSSCGMLGGGGGSDTSSKTGWRYNTPDNGGFEVVTDWRPEAGPGLVFIEGGTFIMGRVEPDLMYDWNATPRRVTVTSFYMDETEVSNVDWREYIFWLKRVYKEYPQVIKNALPDTLVWRSPLQYNEPFVTDYFRHPAYNDYPVVGISWLQANDYCQWRSDRVNEMLLVDKGILDMELGQNGSDVFNTDAYLAGQYQGAVKKNLPSMNPDQTEGRPVRFEDGILLPKYRLPTEAEWEFAASGLVGNTYDERMVERRVYPWNGHNVRNADAKNRGEMMANFVRGRGDYMGLAGNLNDENTFPGPVKSYWPNDYGLYCMAGNVNEWVLDVYRPLSFEDVDEIRPFRGNVFETPYNTDGTYAKKDSLGKIPYRPVTEEEAANRRNYNKSYYVNYKDGDIASTLNYREGETAKASNSDGMYYQGDANAKGNGMTTLVNDHVRVYKGGSWKDRAYWLSPGTRRFLDEASSTNDLGFRCAMEAVGPQSARKRGE